MDHKGFDDRIKNKLSGLNPKFNPDNWDDMLDMLRYSTLKPWYIRWQKAFWTSGLLLFSLLNFYLLWQIRSEASALTGLQNAPQQRVVVIDTVKVVDTVFITKAAFQNASNPPDAPYNDNGRSIKDAGRGFHSPNLFASLSKSSPLHPSWLTHSAGHGSTIDYGGGLERQTSVQPILHEITDPAMWLEDYAGQYVVEGIKTSRKRPGAKRRANPFEARIGLTGGLLVPNPDIGERYISQRIGVIGEFSLKKNLRFLTGVQFNDMTYKLDEVDDNSFNAEDLARYPGYNELGKVPDEIIIENEIMQVPLHLRVYKDLNYNWSVFVSGGPTIDFLLNQSFKYEYIEIDNGQLIEFNEVTREKDLRIYLGNFTGAVGIEHKFSRRLAGQMNVDYQYGLSRIGVERRSVDVLSLNLAAFYKLN